MIPDDISQAVRRLQGGQGTKDDVDLVTAWFNANQASIDTGTSAGISSALGRGKSSIAGAQIGLGNQPTGSYVTPGTPAGLPSSGQNPIAPDFGTGGRITSGIPATPLNLEAIQGSQNSNFPGQSGTWERGVDTYGSNDVAGKQTQLQQMIGNVPQGEGGAALAANPGLSPNYGTAGFENPDILSFYQDLTSGTPLAGMSPAAIDMMSRNPEVFARMLSDQAGGGVNTESFLGPRAEAAMQLAGMGMLGHATEGIGGMPGTEGRNLTSAPSSDVEKMLAAQAFMDQFNAPGAQFVDVNKLFQEEFNRAANTNFEGLTDPQGRPLGIEGSIEMTNNALMASAPFMSQETQAWISSTLNYAAVQYMTELATGKTDMSYPAYLKSLGVDQMLASV